MLSTGSSVGGARVPLRWAMRRGANEDAERVCGAALLALGSEPVSAALPARDRPRLGHDGRTYTLTEDKRRELWKVRPGAPGVVHLRWYHHHHHHNSIPSTTWSSFGVNHHQEVVHTPHRGA